MHVSQYKQLLACMVLFCKHVCAVMKTTLLACVIAVSAILQYVDMLTLTVYATLMLHQICWPHDSQQCAHTAWNLSLSHNMQFPLP